jgi:ubiquinone biosynthesis accessory factor UbiJ
MSESGVSAGLVKLLEGAIAKVMALDATLAHKLKNFEGRHARFLLVSPSITVNAFVRDGAIALQLAQASALNEPDLQIKTDLAHVMQLGLAKLSGSTPSLGVGKIHISGDAELARQLQQIVDQFDPDWDAPFAAVFGDVLGFQLARGARNAAAYAKRLSASFFGSASEYLQEESKDVIARAELEQFYDDVDTLRDRTARLEAKIKLLKTHTND